MFGRGSGKYLAGVGREETLHKMNKKKKVSNFMKGAVMKSRDKIKLN